MNKTILNVMIIILTPFYSYSFSIFGDPIQIPKQKKYIMHGSVSSKDSLDKQKPTIDASMVVYKIQTQATNSNEIYYIQNNQMKKYENSVWAADTSKLISVALFETILNLNIVSRLAFQDINIHPDFTLSGSTPYGPLLNLDNNTFSFYITFYLSNTKNDVTKIKTIRYIKNIDKNTDIKIDNYVKYTNIAIGDIFLQLKPWLIYNLKEQVSDNKEVQLKNRARYK